MIYRYIFWDNDGVLVETERYYLQASREALAQVNIVLSSSAFADISLSKGQSIFDLASNRGLPEAVIDELKAWRNQRYAELLEKEDIALEGVKDVLEKLHGRVNMAIVTSS